MASERQIHVGGVAIGGGAPVVVQSMTLTKTYDVDATMGQIADLASAVSCCASGFRCSGSEPAFAPIRMGIPLALAAWTTLATLSGPPMLPGLIRTAATPASIALRASEALKWMSAMIGTGLR